MLSWLVHERVRMLSGSATNMPLMCLLGVLYNSDRTCPWHKQHKPMVENIARAVRRTISHIAMPVPRPIHVCEAMCIEEDDEFEYTLTKMAQRQSRCSRKKKIASNLANKRPGRTHQTLIIYEPAQSIATCYERRIGCCIRRRPFKQWDLATARIQT